MAKAKKSAKYDIVRNYYLTGRWSKKQFDNAVGKWITQAEYDEIQKEKDSLVELA